MNLRAVTPAVHGVELTAVDFNTDLSEFDAILHKFTYELVDGHSEDVKKVVEFAKIHSHLVFIEPLENISIFLSRMALQEFFRIHPLPSCIEYNEGILLTDETGLEALHFPVLLKSVDGCGTAASHFIQVIHNFEQLQKVRGNGLIAFPFVPHHGTVFKVYVLGDFVVVRAAKSVVINSDAPMTFDSQKPLPRGLENVTFDPEQARKPTDAELREISEVLRRETGIELLGFDLLRREEDQKLVLVDLNYFPCFRDIDDVAGKFARFIRERVSRKA